MYCSNCGTKSDGNSNFCANCGARLTTANEGNNSNQQNSQQYSEPQQQSNQYQYQPMNTNSAFSNQKNPFELYIDGWKHIFNYQGVTSRRGYWWFYLFYIISLVILQLILLAINAQDTFLDQLLVTILMIPLLSISARRMRDTNKSIAWGIIPLVLQWIGQPFMVGDGSTFVNGVLVPFGIIYIVFVCQRTKNTENRERIN